MSGGISIIDLDFGPTRK